MLKKILTLAALSAVALQGSTDVGEIKIQDYSKKEIVSYQNGISAINQTAHYKVDYVGCAYVPLINIDEHRLRNSTHFFNKPESLYILERSFKYTKPTYANILKQYLNKEITYINRNNQNKNNEVSYTQTINGAMIEEDQRKGTIISINPLIIKDTESQQTKLNVRVTDLVFNGDEFEKQFDFKPTLKVKVCSSAGDSEKAIYNTFGVGYLSKALQWDVTYKADFNEEKKTLDTTAWVNVKNETNIPYANYNFSFVSGNLHFDSNRGISHYQNRMAKSMMAEDAVMEMTASAMDFSSAPSNEAGFHIYKLESPLSIHAKETKSFFFERYNLPAELIYETTPIYINNYSLKDGEIRNIDKKLKTKTDLSQQLPKGNIQVYLSKDEKSNDYPLFLSSTNIKEQSPNSEFDIVLGKDRNTHVEHHTTNVEREKIYVLTSKTPHVFIKSFKTTYKIVNNQDKNIKFRLVLNLANEKLVKYFLMDNTLKLKKDTKLGNYYIEMDLKPNVTKEIPITFIFDYQNQDILNRGW